MICMESTERNDDINKTYKPAMKITKYKYKEIVHSIHSVETDRRKLIHIAEGIACLKLSKLILYHDACVYVYMHACAVLKLQHRQKSIS